MMLFKKLNQVGIAHVAALVVVVVGLAAVGTYALVASHAATCTDYVYGNGGSGSCVGYIQRMINSFNYPNSPQLTVDNSYGSKTTSAVKNFQNTSIGVGGRRATSLAAIKADGIVGSQTWYKLCKYTWANEGNYYTGYGATDNPTLITSASNAAKIAGCTRWFSYTY